MIKRGQRLLVGFAERSNFTESKVDLTTDQTLKTDSLSLPMAASFLFGLGIGRKYRKDEMIKQ